MKKVIVKPIDSLATLESGLSHLKKILLRTSDFAIAPSPRLRIALQLAMPGTAGKWRRRPLIAFFNTKKHTSHSLLATAGVD